MKNVQIPYDLFMALLRYHLVEDGSCADEIRRGLEKKLDSMVRHELYDGFQKWVRRLFPKFRFCLFKFPDTTLPVKLDGQYDNKRGHERRIILKRLERNE